MKILTALILIGSFNSNATIIESIDNYQRNILKPNIERDSRQYRKDFEREFQDFITKNNINSSLKLNESYTISLSFLNECFFTDSELLNTPKDYLKTRIKSQLDSLSEFILGFHKGTWGQNGYLFGIKNVKLCYVPKDTNHKTQSLSYNSGGLTLIIPYEYEDNYFDDEINFAQVRSDQIAEMWNRGDMFNYLEEDRAGISKILSSGSKLKSLWPFLNPMGLFQSKIKSYLKNLKVDTNKRIDSIETKDNELEIIDQILKLIEIDKFNEVFDTDILKELNKLNIEQLRELLKIWKQELNSPRLAVNLSQSVLEVMEIVENTNYQLESNASIMVANDHNINISMNIIAQENIRPFLSKKQIDRNYKVKHNPKTEAEFNSHGFGLLPLGGGYGEMNSKASVTVFTVDHININTKIELNKSVENSTLYQALELIK